MRRSIATAILTAAIACGSAQTPPKSAGAPLEPSAAVQRLLDEARLFPAKDQPAAFDHVLSLALALHDEAGQGLAFHAAGLAYLSLGDYPRAADNFIEAAAVCHRTGDRRLERKIRCPALARRLAKIRPSLLLGAVRPNRKSEIADATRANLSP
jgi:hypothetical protein